MALERTPDMEGLSPSERAALYKQRAAAAGIGRPPNAGQPAAAATGARTAEAASASPPAAATTPAPGGAVLAPPAPAAPATRPAGAGVPARVAAAAAARREAVATVARREGPAEEDGQGDRLVYVWPHLVTMEFMAAMLMMLTLIIVGLVLQAPLEAHANPNQTPNPSKAPWYFLNLQELLLHMHPALAGVIIPGGVVFGAIPLIPYLDRNTADVGKWFGTKNAKKICIFTAIYTTVIMVAEIIIDAVEPVKVMMASAASITGWAYLADTAPLGIGALSPENVIVPLIYMCVPIGVLIWIVKRFFEPEGIRDYMFALWTGFVTAYVVLTIVGSFFRGEGMVLMWPWDPRQALIE